ncbi:MAG TPA: cyclic nucleotide-binding domain-containing protein [Roseiflexaceae bacterium]|nr:cyclic nucleotide-binding domain-containing protein [Roseiflexaceae bacterium]
MGTITEHRRPDARARARAAALAQQSEEHQRRQAAALAYLDCLQGVRTEHLLQLANLSTLRVFVPRAVIQSEGTAGSHLFLVLRGTVTLTLHDRAGRKTLIGVLNRGDCFGEGPLFGDRFRGATAQAETVCYLLQARLAEVGALLAEAPELADALQMIYRRRLVESTLARIPLFSQLSPLERMGIAELLRPAEYPRGATIIRENESGDALYLIESGQAIVEQAGAAIAHLDEGDFFGEMSLLAGQPHNADIRALTPMEVLALPVDAFRQLLWQQPALATQLREVAERRRVAGPTFRLDTSRVTQYSGAVERGLLRGTHVLVRDTPLCKPGCRLCEDACASRHGLTRIRVTGVAFNGLEITESCRQCRVGAECIEACPADAIQWNAQGALVITDACTGCGACVPACPYDAVQLVPRARPPASPLRALWQQLRHLRQPTIPLEPAQPAARADKCDLCHGYADLACVASCPTGALRLVPVEELFPL